MASTWPDPATSARAVGKKSATVLLVTRVMVTQSLRARGAVALVLADIGAGGEAETVDGVAGKGATVCRDQKARWFSSVTVSGRLMVSWPQKLVAVTCTV